jgi:Rrf2 family iron-sulfur cluster assembly transcriptional regulator
MHLLAREEIGLRCLLRVAAEPSSPSERGGPCTIAQIAQAEGLSSDYAAKLMRRLRQGGLVESVRGAAGGYRLARRADEITVWQAVQVLDESFLPQSSCDCDPAARGSCRRTAQCAVQSLWCQVGDAVRDTLSGVTLEQLCRASDIPSRTTELPLVEALGGPLNPLVSPQ